MCLHPSKAGPFEGPFKKDVHFEGCRPWIETQCLNSSVQTVNLRHIGRIKVSYVNGKMMLLTSWSEVLWGDEDSEWEEKSSVFIIRERNTCWSCCQAEAARQSAVCFCPESSQLCCESSVCDSEWYWLWSYNNCGSVSGVGIYSIGHTSMETLSDPAPPGQSHQTRGAPARLQSFFNTLGATDTRKKHSNMRVAHHTVTHTLSNLMDLTS